MLFALVLSLLSAGPAKGAIAVKSLTNGARAFIDGEPAGSVPATLKNISAGTHTIKVVRLGYLSFEEQVIVVANKTAEVQADLLPISGVLKVTSSQKNATLWIDGKSVGALPYEGEVQVGKRTVEVRKDGFAAYKQQLSVAAGNDYNINATLVKGKAVSGDDDLPLVALAPPPKKKKVDAEPLSDDIPLAAPLPSRQPLGVQKPFEEKVDDTPVYKTWWFWTAAGGAVAAAIIIPVAISAGSSSEPRHFLPGTTGPWVLSPAR